MTKNWKKFTAANFLYIFLIKNCNLSTLGLHKGRSRYWRSLHPSKENIQHSVADPGCLTRIRIFSIPDTGSAAKNLSILTPKIVSKLSEIRSGLFTPDPDPDFLPIPDPGVKKAPDSALQQMKFFSLFFYFCGSFLLPWIQI
jgi:hypothetical protein